MTLAIVTGATSGIGRAIAHTLLAEGHQVVAIGRQAGALAELAAAGMTTLQLDLSNADATRRALDGLQPDILVNNAGMMPPMVNFCDLSEQDIARTMAVNLSAVLGLTRLLAPGMRQRGRGHVFFTGSTAGHAPFPNLAVYCATKAAIGGFAQALRLDMAPHGVRVTEIVAGRVESGLYNSLLPDSARAAMYANNSAVQPQDVAAMLLSVWKLPPAVDVARFDILPTCQATATGAQKAK